jgi:hypothetical protein
MEIREGILLPELPDLPVGVDGDFIAADWAI